LKDKNETAAREDLAIDAPLLPAGPEQGRTYYVSTNGDDSNPGTEELPFRTLHHGVGGLAAGDTLYVRSGTYAEGLDAFPSGDSWANPVTLAAYPGETVTLKPDSGFEVLRFMRCQYVVVDGFVLDGSRVRDNVVKITTEAHHIRIQNSEIRGAPSQGILVTTDGPIQSDFNEFINLDVHHNGTTDFDHGLYIETSHNRIDHSSIHNNAGWGVHIYSQGCSDCANDNVIRNNLIYDNAAAGERGPGILLSSGTGSLAYNNLIWGNFKGIQVDHGASAAQVYNNVVYANDDYGIELTGDSADAIIRNNIVYQNGEVAISDAGLGTIQDHNLVDTDPQFMDAAAHNFRLRPGSPAIDAGIALSAVQNDFAGVSRPQGAGFDIGAFEYEASSLTPTPVASATPTNTPTAIPTNTPLSTPSPTPAPAETLAPSPTPNRSSTPTPTPSITSSPTPTPKPSSTASPTASQEPTHTSTLSPTPVPTPTAAPAEGDLNNDGHVNVLDVQLCVNVYLGTEANPSIMSRADVNSDGQVDVLDVQVIANIALAG
jgi:hypothetical protein